MYRGRTLSLSLPPFTKAVKWLVLVNGGMFLFTTLLKAVAPAFGETFSLVLSLVPSFVLHGWIFQLVTYSFLHATILHLLGLDHERLTFRYQGRAFRLTDIAGRVAEKLIN